MSETRGGGDDFEFGVSFDTADAQSEFRAFAFNIKREFDRVFDSPKGKKALGQLFDTNSLIGDLNALQRRVEAFKDTLSKQGANPELFAVLNQEVEKAIRLQKKLADDQVEIARNPNLREALEQQAQLIARTTRAELSSTERLLKNQRSLEQQAAKDRQIQAAANYRQEEDVRRRAHSKMVIDTQQFTTLENATIRTAGQRQVAEIQANSRRRIEIMRFAFRQIVFLEQQLARAVRGAFSIAGSAFGSIQAGAARLGQVFRRSNNELNDGLRGALTQRERALSRSFRNQTNTIQAETNRQQRAVQQLERQMSTGVLGILSGRSRFAGAFGAGALIGGGLTGANLFSAGLDRFQSLEKANLQLERMLGSATAARRALNELDTWARGTPLALDLVTEIAVGLISMGTAAEDVLPRLEAITDAVAFTGGGADEIRRVGLAIRQVASAGRLLGQDFNQIAQALPGLNLAQLLADQLTGGNTAEFLKLRESGELSAKQFVQAFVAGVQNNPAIAGSTASLGATLQGQISNLNAAWRRLGAAIITQFEAPLRRSIQRMRDNLSFLAKFVQGDVSDGFLALRSALIGVAYAMAAIVAARTAVQVLQLLGVAARFALTPMGFLVTAITAIAAAVGALRAVSDNFRYVTDGLRDLVSDSVINGVRALPGLLDLLAEKLATLVRPFAEGFLPKNQLLTPFVVLGAALRRLGDIALNVASRALSVLIVAFRVVVAVVRAVLIPAIQAAFRFLVDTGIPAAVNLASALTQYLIPAVIALAAAWLAVNAPLAVTIGTLAAVGAALLILRANSDRVREFTDNLADSFVNLGRKIGGIGRVVGSAAVSAFEALRDALGELLSRIDYGDLASRILGFVNTLGRLLGRAITSRFAVQAGVYIAAAAIALAGSFLLGFGEGIITGLPGAIDAFVDALRNILEAAGVPDIFTGLFRNAFTGIGAIILAVIAASSLLRSFTSAGSRVAGAFSQGFGTALRSGITNAFRSISALAAPDATMKRIAANNARAYQSEFDRIMRNNQRLGISSPLVSSGAISRDALRPQDLQRLSTEQQRLLVGFDQMIVKAALFRRTFSDVLRDSGNRMQAFRDLIAQQGGWGAVGQKAGVAVVTGFSAALAGQQGGTAGLVGVVAATLGGLALGGPIVAGMTALVGGATLLWQELNKGDEAAKRMEETFNRIRDSLIGLDANAQVELLARELGDVILEEIPNFGFTAGLDLVAEAQRAIRQGAPDFGSTLDDIFGNLNLQGPLIDPIFGDELVAQLAAVGLGEGALLDLAAAYEEVGQAASKRDTGNFTREEQELLLTLSRVDSALRERGSTLDDLSELFRILTGNTGGFSAAQREAAVASTWITELPDDVAVAAEGIAGMSLTIQQEMALIDRAISGAGRGPATQWDKVLQFDAVESVVSRVIGVVEGLGWTSEQVFAAVRQELEKTGITMDGDLRRSVMDMIRNWILFGKASEQAGLDGSFSLDEMNRAAREAGAAIRAAAIDEEMKEIADEAERAAARANLVKLAVQQLNQERSDRIRKQIEGVRTELDRATKAADAAKSSITSFFAPPKNASRLVDEAILNLDSVGSNIEDAMNKGGLQGQAAIRVALGGFNDTIASIIQQGFEDGLRTQEEFAALLAPLQAAMGEVVNESAQRILSTVDFTAGITPAAGGRMADALSNVLRGREIEANVTAAFAAQREVERIQAELDRLNAQLDVNAVFSESQIKEALIAAGLPPEILIGFDFSGQGLSPLQQSVLEFLSQQQGTGAGGPTITGPVSVNITPDPNPIATSSAVVTTIGAIATGAPMPANVKYGTNLVTGNTYNPPTSYRPGVPQ